MNLFLVYSLTVRIKTTNYVLAIFMNTWLNAGTLKGFWGDFQGSSGLLRPATLYQCWINMNKVVNLSQPQSPQPLK